MNERRAIGFVLWYNGINPKVCGIIVTTSLDLSIAPEQQRHFLKVELHQKQWPNTRPLSPGDWLVFSLATHSKRVFARDVRRLMGTEEDLRIALQYTGDNARIRGVDYNGKRLKSYNSSILAHCLELFAKGVPENQWHAQFRRLVANHVLQIPLGSWSTWAEELASDNDTRQHLWPVFLAEEDCGADGRSEFELLLQDALVRAVLRKKVPNALAMIPSWFDLRTIGDEVCQYVNQLPVAQAIDHSVKKFGPAFTELLKCHRKTVNWHPDVLVTLSAKLDDLSWLSDFIPSDWTAFAHWLNDFSRI